MSNLTRRTLPTVLAALNARATVSATAPPNPTVGAIWLDTTLVTGGLKVWDGSVWQTATLHGNVDGTTITGAQVVATGVAGELLIYDGTPASGNLILAVSGSLGADGFSNPFAKGLSLPALDGALAQSYLSWVNRANPADTRDKPVVYATTSGGTPLLDSLILKAPRSAGTAVQLQLSIGNGFTLVGTGGASVSGISGTVVVAGDLQANAGLKAGNGPLGKYYAVNATFSKASVANNTITALTGITKTHEHTDYTNPWSSATFTPPVDGYYDIGLNIDGVTSSTKTGGRILVGGVAKAGNSTSFGGNFGAATASLTSYWLTATDTVTFDVFQQSGAAATVTGGITLARRL